jgi:putative GTP pyrophosphokinase
MPKVKPERKGVTASRPAPTPTPTPDDIWRRDPETVRRYLTVRPDYKQLCVEVEYILRKRISEIGVETAAVTSRAKTLDSFLEKLQRKHYADPFTEITDLAGVRVVCLYRSDVPRVAEVIRSEFDVIEDADKVKDLGVDQFGYAARHFIVSLGKASSGARYDDLKGLRCEVQVRTIVQDAWAIIQHHMVYKRESQAPPEVQRKLNSLAGLLETADDQFERIRQERETYVARVRASAEKPVTFLENELNLDTFREYLSQRYPDRAVESWDGQARVTLDGLLAGGFRRLRDLDKAIEDTASAREALISELDNVTKAADGTVPSNIEPALALVLTAPNWRELIPFSPKWQTIIGRYRSHKTETG